MLGKRSLSVERRKGGEMRRGTVGEAQYERKLPKMPAEEES